MNASFFIDSNVALYALGTASLKRDIARKLIGQVPVISTQVVMEAINISVRKLGYSKEKAFENAANLMDSTVMKTITQPILLKAFEISLLYRYSHWDSLIIASALEANCTILYSEDMQHGQVIENKLTIVNPFV